MAELSQDVVRSYLPHRRQRPLSDTTLEYQIMDRGVTNTSSKDIPLANRLFAVALAVIAGLGTIGIGAYSLNQTLEPSMNPQVAGIYTESSAEDFATPQFQPIVCWNQVVLEGGVFSWPNSCRGLAPAPNRICDPTLTPLAQSELQAYQMWFDQDQVLPPDCLATPSQVKPRNPFR